MSGADPYGVSPHPVSVLSSNDLAVAKLTPGGRALVFDSHAFHRSPSGVLGGATLPPEGTLTDRLPLPRA